MRNLASPLASPLDPHRFRDAWLKLPNVIATYVGITGVGLAGYVGFQYAMGTLHPSPPATPAVLRPADPAPATLRPADPVPLPLTPIIAQPGHLAATPSATGAGRPSSLAEARPAMDAGQPGSLATKSPTTGDGQPGSLEAIQSAPSTSRAGSLEAIQAAPDADPVEYFSATQSKRIGDLPGSPAAIPSAPGVGQPRFLAAIPSAPIADLRGYLAALPLGPGGAAPRPTAVLPPAAGADSATTATPIAKLADVIASARHRNEAVGQIVSHDGNRITIQMLAPQTAEREPQSNEYVTVGPLDPLHDQGWTPGSDGQVKHVVYVPAADNDDIGHRPTNVDARDAIEVPTERLDKLLKTLKSLNDSDYRVTVQLANPTVKREVENRLRH